MRTDCSRQADCRVTSRARADTAFPLHTTQPGPWSCGKTRGTGPGACPLVPDFYPLAVCPWVSHLTSPDGERYACFFICEYGTTMNRVPTLSPVLCIPDLISSSQQPCVVGIPTRVGLTPDTRLFSPDCFLKASRLVYHLCGFCHRCVPLLLLFSNWNTLILKGKYISLLCKENQYHLPLREDKLKVRNTTMV